MPNQPEPVNYQLLRLYVDTIPPFDGNPHTLSIFIDNCTSLINQFHRANDDAHNNFIVRAIIGKLSGRALSLIGSRTSELKTWDDVKSALQLSFGDQRNLDCLVQDLITLSPIKNETPYNFGMRCQDARSLVFSKLSTLNLNNNELDIKRRSYDDLALKTFIRGLTGQIQNNIRLRNPQNLETAMSLVIEEENFLYSQSRGNSLNFQNFKLNQRITPASVNNPNKNINYQNNQQPNFAFPKPIFNNNPMRPNPFQPFGFQPRPNPFQSFGFQQRPNPFQSTGFQPRPNPFQMNQQFRPNYNNQRPSQVIRNNQFRQPFNNFNQYKPKPEPMDTTSGTNARINHQRNVTALHQQDIENNPYNPNQYLDYSEYDNFDQYDQEQYYFDEQNNYYNQYNDEMPYDTNDLYAEQNTQLLQPSETLSVPENTHTNAAKENELNFQIITTHNEIT